MRICGENRIQNIFLPLTIKRLRNCTHRYLGHSHNTGSWHQRNMIYGASKPFCHNSGKGFYRILPYLASNLDSSCKRYEDWNRISFSVARETYHGGEKEKLGKINRETMALQNVLHCFQIPHRTRLQTQLYKIRIAIPQYSSMDDKIPSTPFDMDPQGDGMVDWRLINMFIIIKVLFHSSVFDRL